MTEVMLNLFKDEATVSLHTTRQVLCPVALSVLLFLFVLHDLLYSLIWGP